MKGFALFIAAVFSASAFASKARVNSLLGADHLVDTQTVFTVPSHVNLLNPFMTFEFGAQGAGAEGGILRKAGGGNLMVYLGHQNLTENFVDGDLRASAGYIAHNNPIEVIYGKGNHGFALSLSHVDNETAGTKDTSLVGKWGMNYTPESWVWAHVHLYDTAEKTAAGVTDEISWMPYLRGGISHAMGNYRVFGTIEFGKGEQEFGTPGAQNQDITDTNVSIGFEDRTLKMENADIYYGIGFLYNKRDYDGDEASGYALPAFLGIEAPVLSWATVRASVQQNVIVGKTETKTAGTTTEAGINANTLVAAGLGFKHGNFILDGALTAAANGNINGNQFLSQASLTYNF